MVRALGGHASYVGTLAPDGKTLASGQRDTTALLWDVAETVQRPHATNVSARDLVDLWNDLGAADARRAHAAAWKLAGAGAAVTRFLQERMKPVPFTDRERIRKLIADLDHTQDACECWTCIAEALGHPCWVKCIWPG